MQVCTNSYFYEAEQSILYIVYISSNIGYGKLTTLTVISLLLPT